MIRNTQKIRPAVIKGDFAYIPLGVGGRDGFAKVDLIDASLDRYAWRLNTTGYPYTLSRGKSTGRKRIFMHRMIIGDDTNGVVDHINRDHFDNRRANLRVCTQNDNVRNCKRHSSKYPYRCVRPNGKKGWMAYLTYKGKQVYLGTHKTIEEAALAYNSKASELFGEFAVLNEVHINS